MAESYLEPAVAGAGAAGFLAGEDAAAVEYEEDALHEHRNALSIVGTDKKYRKNPQPVYDFLCRNLGPMKNISLMLMLATLFYLQKKTKHQNKL